MASSSADGCPVDHSTRAAWAQSPHTPLPVQDHPPPATLPTEREVSSIPRVDGDKWVYPSQAQFYSAMARKNHSPRESDMSVVVPIHNAVNERAWNEVMKWESGRGGEKCGGVKLVTFKGNAGDTSVKARVKMLFGYVVFRFLTSSFSERLNQRTFFFPPSLWEAMLHPLTGTIG